MYTNSKPVKSAFCDLSYYCNLFRLDFFFLSSFLLTYIQFSLFFIHIYHNAKDITCKNIHLFSLLWHFKFNILSGLTFLNFYWYFYLDETQIFSSSLQYNKNSSTDFLIIYISCSKTVSRTYWVNIHKILNLISGYLFPKKT